MIVAVAADHGGYSLKQALLPKLEQENYKVIDLGTKSLEAVDYPDFALSVGEAILRGCAERGIIICGSGVGVSVAANKIPGIRAGLCHDTFSAHQGVEDDNMNILCLGARVIGLELAFELIQTFLTARFSGKERHLRRLAKIASMECTCTARTRDDSSTSLPP